MYPYQATPPYSPQLAQHQVDNHSYHQNQHQQNQSHHQSSRQFQQQGDGHNTGEDPYRRVSVPGFNNLPAMLQQSLIGTPPTSGGGGFDFHSGNAGQGMNLASGMSRYPMQGNGSHHLGDEMNGRNGSSMGDYSHLGHQMNQHHASGTSTPANNLGGGGGSAAGSPMMIPTSSSSSAASRNRQRSSVFQDEMAIMKRKRGSIDQDDLNVHLRQHHHQRSGGTAGHAGTGAYSPFPFGGHGMQDTGFGAHRFPSAAGSTTGTSSLPISRRGSAGHVTTTNTTNTTESSPTHTRDVSPYQTSSSPHHQGYGQYGQQQRQPQQGGAQSNGVPSHPHASAPSSTSSSLTKKPRLIKACEPCRLRKIGCDGTHPVCQRCRADDRVGECRFIKTIVRSSLTRKRMTELEDRLERWERIWNGFLGGDAGSGKNGHAEDEIDEDEETPVGEVDVDVIERSLRDKGERGRAMRGKIVERLGGTLLSSKGNREVRSGRNPPESMNGFAVQTIKQEPMGLPNYLAAVPPSQSVPRMHSALSQPLPLNGLGLEPGPIPVPTMEPSHSNISRPSEWNQTSAQINKNLDGTGSFTRSGGSGSTYLGLSSGVTFLNAILKLCKERGGIFIDVENAIPSTVPGLTMGGNVVDAATVNVVKQITAPSTNKERKSGVSSGWNDHATVNDPEIIKNARTLPSKEEYGPLVDSYFAYFHGITPMVHEPTIRAILNGEKPFPENDSFLALLYMIFAMGALDSVLQESDDHGQKYCDIARAILNSDIMESASMELVQTIAILANYLQRNDKPNAGYLCLGAAVRMAIGIGLHVHDNDDKLTPLEAEMRKRVWWSVSVLESGCSKTFGRPSGLCGINLFQIPLATNIDDNQLTHATKVQPPDLPRETLYSTLIGHSKLARATTILHTSILQLQPAPSLEQIKQYDRMILQVIGDLPSYITYPNGPVTFGFSRYVLIWRLRDWRAILYRPILLAAAWDQVKEKHLNPAIVDAISICRSLATENLGEMADYFRTAQSRGANRAEEWYCMYFAHQSSLTLLLSLVGEPAHVEAESWRQTILATASWFRQLQAMKTAGTALASILENVVFATASIPIRDQTSITPTDNWLLNQNKQGGQAVVPNDALDVMRYWNALCPEGTNGPVWDDSIWNAMMSMNPETLA